MEFKCLIYLIPNDIRYCNNSKTSLKNKNVCPSMYNYKTYYNI